MTFDPLANMYAKIATADVSQSGTYLSHGIYKVRIESASFKLSRKQKTLFLVEFTILESTEPTRPAGTRASWTCNLTDHDSAPGNVKGFIGVCLGIPPGDKARLDSEITPAVISGATGANNPLGGLVLALEVQPTKTRGGGDFSRHNWGPLIGRDSTWTPAPAGALPAAMAAAPAPAPVPMAPRMPAPPPPPPVAPPPPPLPVVWQIPAGWQEHPSAPGWYWHPATGEVRSKTDLGG